MNLVNGFVNQAAEAIIDVYGGSDKVSVNRVWVRTVGALGVAGLLLFVFDTTINIAMGWMATVWIAENF